MTHASLFSGIGGPEVAAAMLGWENAFHCEINPFGRAVLEYWFPDSVSYEDITKTDFREWRGRIDVLTGGFPCQPFSYAGQRRGHEDDRYLWPQMLRAIDEIRPAWVVCENVAGLSTMVEGWVLTEMGSGSSLFEEDKPFHDYLLEQTFTIDKIAKELEDLGYSVQPVLIPAAAVGAPHRRDRIFILAHNDADRESLQFNGSLLGDGRDEKREEVSQPGSRSCKDATYSDSRRSGEIPTSVHAREPDGDESFCYGGDGSAPHANCPGREESVQPGRGEDRPENEAGMDDRVERSGENGHASDTEKKQYDRVESGKRESGRRQVREIGGCIGFSVTELLPENRWAEFPTVSPVHAGNDGIPIGLDGITLPAAMQPRTYRNSDPQRFNFGRWRTESLKAYGNAIVPQVMYQIFKAIETI